MREVEEAESAAVGCGCSQRAVGVPPVVDEEVGEAAAVEVKGVVREVAT